jgi:hypothetical protein
MKHLIVLLLTFVVLAAGVQADRLPDPPPINAGVTQPEFDFGGALMCGHLNSDGYWGFSLEPEIIRPPIIQWAKKHNAQWTLDPREAELIVELSVLVFRPGQSFMDAALGRFTREYGISIDREKWVVRSTVMVYEVSDHEYGSPIPGRYVAGPFIGVGKCSKVISWTAFLNQYNWFRGIDFTVGQRDLSARQQYVAFERSLKNLRLMED